MKFLIGLCLGIILAAFVAYYLNKAPTPFVDKGIGPDSDAPISQFKNSATPMLLAPGTTMQQASSAPIATKPTASAPVYDFYDVLQGKKDLAAKPSSAPIAETNHGYLIQAGAFSDADLANNMKARLALLGFSSQIKAQQENNILINRVLIGPFRDLNDAKDTMEQLKQQQVNATIINLH